MAAAAFAAAIIVSFLLGDRRLTCCRFTRRRPAIRQRLIAAAVSTDRVLYWGMDSQPCWRVLIALAEKELPFESRQLDWAKSAQQCQHPHLDCARSPCSPLADAALVHADGDCPAARHLNCAGRTQTCYRRASHGLAPSLQRGCGALRLSPAWAMHASQSGVCKLCTPSPWRSAGEHKSPEVLAVNPRGKLPAFRDGSIIVNESMAALMYLEDAYDSGTRLLPREPAARALVSGQKSGFRCMVV